jgi:hypothetical protein
MNSRRPEREIRVLHSLLRLVPNLKSRILASSTEEVQLIADLVRPTVGCSVPKFLTPRFVLKGAERNLEREVRRHEKLEGRDH